MGTLAPLQSRSSETGVSSPLKTLSLPQLHSDTNQPPQEPSHQRGLTRRGVERKEMGPSCSLSFLLRRLGQGQFPMDVERLSGRRQRSSPASQRTALALRGLPS